MCDSGQTSSPAVKTSIEVEDLGCSNSRATLGCMNRQSYVGLETGGRSIKKAAACAMTQCVAEVYPETVFVAYRSACSQRPIGRPSSAQTYWAQVQSSA